MIRARAVAGSPETIDAFVQVRHKTLAQPRDPEKLRDDIVEMRERMRQELDRSDEVYFDLKQGVGGITDIEFMVQYAVLRWAPKHHELLAVTDNLRLLEILTRFGLIVAGTGTGLHNAYFAYRTEAHRCALQEVDGLFDMGTLTVHRETVTKFWHKTFESH